jgi:hypothetical protein
VTTADPVVFFAGCKARLPVALGLEYVTTGLGNNAVLSEVAVTVNDCTSLEAPELIPASGMA